MRILQVNTESTWRGGERQTLYTLIGLIEKGVEVELMALSGSIMQRRAEEYGITVVPVNGMADVVRKIFALRYRYTCIHAQSAKAHTQMVVTKFLHGLPVLYTRRVDFVPSGWATGLKYGKTDQVISISRKISEILEEAGMWNDSVVISSAVKEKKLDQERATHFLDRLHLKETKKIVGIISALELHKDPLGALEMAELLYEERKDFVVVHFGDGAMAGEIKSAIRDRGMNSYYYLMGHVDSVEDFFALFDVFVMTSKEEGLGSSVLDAFFYEVPVVSTKAGGLLETVQGRGWLAEVGDASGLASGVNQALEEGDGVKKWTQSAKEYVQENCTVNAMVEKYISLYEKYQ